MNRRALALWWIGAASIARADQPHPAAGAPLWSEGRHAARAARDAFVKLAQAIGPAVVNVSTLQLEEDPAHGPQHRHVLGTGVVIHRSGLIVTANHVLDHAVQVRVVFADESERRARVVGRDERTDIALLEVDADRPLTVAPLGDSDRVEIGEPVLAIGNPFGLDHTVTRGIVSGKGRRDIRIGGPTNAFYDFIQTDASINTGNSGGPLIDERGEVIGINTAVNAQAQGIAFAIPINMVKTIVKLLYTEHRAPRSWLGVVTQPLTPPLRRAFGIADARGGALVAEVIDPSPAFYAGLAVGDIVLAIDAAPIRRADDFGWIESTLGVGRAVTLSVERAGHTVELHATLARDPAEPPLATPRPPPEHVTPFGMTVAEITIGIARELGDPALRGLVVMAVEPESPAGESGVEQRDLLLRVGDQPVATIEQYAAAVNAIPSGGMIRLLLRHTAEAPPPRSHGEAPHAEPRALWVAFPKR